MLIVAIGFLLTRFYWLAKFPHFYDSPEYVRLAQTQGFFDALRTSHESLHPIYLYLIQEFYAVFGTVQSISGVSAIFGLLSVAGFAWLLYELGFNEKIKHSLLLLLVFPATWLIHTNVMHESVGHAFLLTGVASIFRWFNTKKLIWALVATLVLAAAYLNYVGLILWFPVIVALVWWKGFSVLWTLLILGLSLIVGQSSLWVLMQLAHIEQTNRFGYIFSVELPQILQLFTPFGFLRTLRNVLFMIGFGYSPFILIGFFKNWKKRDLIFMSVACVSLMASMSFWHGGLYGRLGSLIGFFLAGLMAIHPFRSWKYHLVLVSSLLLFIFNLVSYSKKPQAVTQFELIGNGYDLVVISDSQRPQLEYLGLKNYQVISPQTVTQAVERMDFALKNEKHVLITQQALTAPYWQYDGQLVHIISLNNKPGVLSEYLKDKEVNWVAGEGMLSVFQLLVQ